MASGDIGLAPEPVDVSSKFKQHLEAEKVLQNLYRTDF